MGSCRFIIINRGTNSMNLLNRDTKTNSDPLESLEDMGNLGPKSNAINDSIEPEQNRGMATLLQERILKRVQACPRTISLTGDCQPVNYQNNIVKNTKYNLLTFLPLVLYNQFKFFFNLFFLITALTQLIEVLRVGLFITFIGPLIMVLSLTVGKEAYDDYRTYQRDI